MEAEKMFGNMSARVFTFALILALLGGVLLVGALEGPGTAPQKTRIAGLFSRLSRENLEFLAGDGPDTEKEKISARLEIGLEKSTLEELAGLERCLGKIDAYDRAEKHKAKKEIGADAAAYLIIDHSLLEEAAQAQARLIESFVTQRRSPLATGLSEEVEKAIQALGPPQSISEERGAGACMSLEDKMLFADLLKKGLCETSAQRADYKQKTRRLLGGLLNRKASGAEKETSRDSFKEEVQRRMLFHFPLHMLYCAVGPDSMYDLLDALKASPTYLDWVHAFVFSLQKAVLQGFFREKKRLMGVFFVGFYEPGSGEIEPSNGELAEEKKLRELEAAIGEEKWEALRAVLRDRAKTQIREYRPYEDLLSNADLKNVESEIRRRIVYNLHEEQAEKAQSAGKKTEKNPVKDVWSIRKIKQRFEKLNLEKIENAKFHMDLENAGLSANNVVSSMKKRGAREKETRQLFGMYISIWKHLCARCERIRNISAEKKGVHLKAIADLCWSRLSYLAFQLHRTADTSKSVADIRDELEPAPIAGVLGCLDSVRALAEKEISLHRVRKEAGSKLDFADRVGGSAADAKKEDKLDWAGNWAAFSSFIWEAYPLSQDEEAPLLMKKIWVRMFSRLDTRVRDWEAAESADSERLLGIVQYNESILKHESSILSTAEKKGIAFSELGSAFLDELAVYRQSRKTLGPEEAGISPYIMHLCKKAELGILRKMLAKMGTDVLCAPGPSLDGAGQSSANASVCMQLRANTPNSAPVQLPPPGAALRIMYKIAFKNVLTLIRMLNSAHNNASKQIRAILRFLNLKYPYKHTSTPAFMKAPNYALMQAPMATHTCSSTISTLRPSIIAKAKSLFLYVICAGAIGALVIVLVSAASFLIRYIKADK